MRPKVGEFPVLPGSAEKFEVSSVEKIEIPRKTLYRLSIYLRCLEELGTDGVETVSSDELAEKAGVKSTQLRKDLGHVGQFGTRGLGYNVRTLDEALSGVMGQKHLQPVILVGLGNLGAALLHYGGFRKEGFEIIAAFDADPEAVSHRAEDIGVPVRDAEELGQYVRLHEVKMAILAVPQAVAQDVADTLVAAGLEAILNFSPTVLRVPDNVIVNHVDLAAELESLRYFVS